MTTTITKTIFSGSTNGRPIKVAASSTPGTAIHTCHATDLDEVTLFAENKAGSTELLTIEIGGTTDPDNLIEVTLPAAGADGDGPQLVIPGLCFTGSTTIAAFSASGNVVLITGYVNRINVT